ncbi:hypothetical protein [Guptibacillus spartinae]|uniref:hypothetical protein n=1 Tax=Guptibacillus spartinae TaxID=3025679 RepID=UPI002361748D|nr:hypothetical protein [Pseudalkalibacillus spartinae]
MKKIVLIVTVLFLLLILMTLGPYNPFLEFSEEKSLREFITDDHQFKGEEIVEIDYRGSDTYYLQTKEDDQVKHYIVMRYATSMMNGHWKVFEQSSIENQF